MADGFTSKKDKLEFKEIALSNLKGITEIARHEFRGGYRRQVPMGNGIITEYVPDQRKIYIQSVEVFNDILLPHFDKAMKEKSKEYVEAVNNIIPNLKKKRNKDYELDLESDLEIKELEDVEESELELWKAKKEIEHKKFIRKSLVVNNKISVTISRRHLELARGLFQQLNLLLKRIDYLKESVYGETKDETVEED